MTNQVISSQAGGGGGGGSSLEILIGSPTTRGAVKCVKFASPAVREDVIPASLVSAASATSSASPTLTATPNSIDFSGSGGVVDITYQDDKASCLKSTADDMSMSTTSNSRGITPGGEFPDDYYVTRLELLKLTNFNFPYGLICGTMALCVLPAEAARLTPLFQSYSLGFFLGVVGLSQLVCPIIGKVSDKYEARSPFGQRIPFFFFGSCLATISTLFMWISSITYSFVGFSIALLTGMCGLNICSSIQTGLVPSFVDTKRSGEASGICAIGTLLGASIGFAIIAICNQWDFHFVYPLYASLLSCGLLITMSACGTLDTRLYDSLAAAKAKVDLEANVAELNNQRSVFLIPQGPVVEEDLADLVGGSFPASASFLEHPATTTSPGSNMPSNFSVKSAPSRLNKVIASRELEEIESPIAASIQSHVGGAASPYRFDDILLSQSKLAKSVEAQDLLLSYYLPLNNETRDFFWVFIGRTFYYVAVSVQAFILYYLRDVVNTADEATRMTQVGIMALTAQACAAVVAYPLGRSIDTMGVSRKLLIYLACFIMSVCYFMLAISPVFGANAFYFVWFSAVVYGIGNGCFLAVDYSIALTTLPDKSKAAQSLGIWGLSAFVGSALGPLLWGFAVQILGTFHAHSRDAGEMTYSYWGYLCMLLGGIAATGCSALCIATLRSVR